MWRVLVPLTDEFYIVLVECKFRALEVVHIDQVT